MISVTEQQLAELARLAGADTVEARSTRAIKRYLTCEHLRMFYDRQPCGSMCTKRAHWRCKDCWLCADDCGDGDE
jgi:hypothetical protein